MIIGPSGGSPNVTQSRQPQAALALFALLGGLFAGNVSAALSIQPIAWNIIGLDSNNVTVGPNRFPGAARVCTDAAPSNGPITVTWNWTSADPFIDLRAGSLNPVVLPALAANSCADAFFEVEIVRNASAYDHTRRYRIDADDADPGVTATAEPREVYVEHLISQSRNAVSDIQFGTSIPSLVSVAAGGSMNLVVGNTYFIRLIGGTATQGYEQLETFIGFKNTIFQILSVASTFPADTSATVSSPTDVLYLDGCVWENDVNSPNYRSCLSTGKTGGAPVAITYQVRIVSGAGTTETLSSLFHDFSGSSYHYNADFSSSVRFANILDPTTSTISKSFTPSTIPVNGISTLSFVIGNPNAFSVSGYSLIDNLPAGVVVANPPTTSTSGCGTPTFSPTAGATTLNFSNGTVGANSSCTFTVQVTSAATATYNNTTEFLLIDGISTTRTASATLIVNNQPAPPACTNGLELATWRMAPAAGTGVPPAFTFKSNRVSSATANYAGTGTQAISTAAITGSAVNYWQVTSGWPGDNTGFPNPAAPYFEFVLDTSNFTGVGIAFDYAIRQNWANFNDNHLYVYSSADGAAFTTLSDTSGFTKTDPFVNRADNAFATGSSTTTFRINVVGQQNDSAEMYLDNIVFTGCGVPAQPPLSKAFVPTTIAVGATSTLTFTLGNENNIALTGAAFTDALPSGLQVAATPAATSSCGGTWAPTAGSTTLTFTGGTIPGRVGTVNGSCTLSVAVTATSPGARTNVSGPISTTQTGTNSGPTGFGTASLTAISPPLIAKQFTPSSILGGGVSTLTFTISNPNPSNAIAGVAFSDTFPVAPAAMVVAPAPLPTNTCSPAGTWTTTAGAGSVSLSGAGVPAGGSCTVSVNVLAPAVGTYNNTSGLVSHIVNGVTINGNSASAALLVNAAAPSISLIKQISTSALGPWTSYVAVPLGTPLFYQFTVENTGDVPLVMPASPGYVTDVSVPGPNVDTSSCFAGWTSPLPVAVSGNDNHIDSCVVGPINAVASGVVNTGTASSPTGPSTDTSVASYGVTGLSLDKTADVSIFGFVGQVINYSYLVTNTGSAVLNGPVTIADDRSSTEICPALTTIGDFDNFFDPGETITCSATYTITAADVTAGSVTNIATASAGGATSPSDTVTITYEPPVLNVTKSVNPNPVSIGEQATYTVGITNTGLVATSANIIINDTLPDFMTFVSASGSNWTCDGLVPLTCTFTGILAANGGATSLSIVVNVGVGTLNGNNTARASGGGDPGCPAPPAVALARCSGTVIVGTVPVILSKASVQVEGSELVVRFGTASEDGALGFRVHASRDGLAARQALGPELHMAKAELLAPQAYQMRGAYTGQTQVWIEELSVKGESTFHGPFAVGASLGAGLAEEEANWTLVRSEQNAFLRAEQQSIADQLQGAVGAAEVEVRIAQSGWVRLRYEDLLAQGIDWSGVAATRIELLRGQTRIPVEAQGGAVFGPGSALAFLGEAVSGSLYTSTAVYRLRLADAALPLPAVFAGVGALGVQTHRTDRFEHAPNRQYSSSSPLDDPWYARRLLRNGVALAALDESFVLPEKFDGEKPEQIEVEMWGGLDFPEAPDHSLRVLLNGSEIGSARFDGVTRYVLRAELPAGLLRSGSNTLTLELIGDTGLPADVVHLEAIRIDYDRRLLAVDDRIDFRLPTDLPGAGVEADRLFVDDFDDGGSAACASASQCAAYLIDGLSSSDAVVLREREGQVVRLLASSQASADGGYQLRFASSRRAGDHYWVAPAAGAVAAELALAAALEDPLAGAAADYLIVSHPSFVDGLAPLIAARQAEGFRVRVVNVLDLYRFYNDGVVDPIAIQLALSEAYQRLGTRYVLLVGGDTLDYFNYTGANSVSFLPTPYRITHRFIRFGAADSVYADIDDDGLADLSIGRFPVRTRAELDALVAKTLNYASASFGGQSVLLSDRNSGGINYGDQLAPLGNYLGNGWTMNALRLQNYPSGAAAQARADLVGAVNDGQALVAYLGHSAPSTWTFEGLLTSSQIYAGAFSNASQPSLVWSIGCYGGYFVDPSYNTIAHGLLLQNNGGAAAMLGATGLTEVSSDVAWINTLGTRLTSERIGDAQRQAQRILAKAGPEFRDVAVGGTLLGDPALRLHQ
ncbi:MAG: C25 family cysteine peptidase [Lysobacterales bacterium]